MSVLAALTPPFLVCAVVIGAIVAFLRHEMGRGRQDRDVASKGESADAPTATDEIDYGVGSDTETATSRGRDG
jgi:hypothetical protein